jgi:predicted neutral ceramidase superfamily lipid hydrolase
LGKVVDCRNAVKEEEQNQADEIESHNSQQEETFPQARHSSEIRHVRKKKIGAD